MAHLTTLDELKHHITLLASVEETDAPFISAYLNLENGQSGWRDMLDERARILRRILKGNDLADLEIALDKIEDWMASNLLPESKGVAIFVRGIFGGSFMLPMQFDAPLPNWMRSIRHPISTTWWNSRTTTTATWYCWPHRSGLASWR